MEADDSIIKASETEVTLENNRRDKNSLDENQFFRFIFLDQISTKVPTNNAYQEPTCSTNFLFCPASCNGDCSVRKRLLSLQV